MGSVWIALGSFLVGSLVGAAGVRYQGRQDRRDAERLRREVAAAARASVTAAADYGRGLIILYNAGPANATDVRVTSLKGGRRSRERPAFGDDRWPLPAPLPAGGELALRVALKETVGDWIDLTLAWRDADGTVRSHDQRITWAG
jgi:hypothetical protein